MGFPHIHLSSLFCPVCLHRTLKRDMASTLAFHCLLSLLLLFPVLSSSQDAFICSRATYYGSPDCSGTPSGACGYGEFGRDVNGGDVGAVSRLYRNGSGCGACYQVRCAHPQLCNQDGLKIVVTDHGEGDNTDFILSARGFVKLARPNMAAELMAFGVVDVEYRRISCQYPGYNMMIKVTEQSRYPDYLAMNIIYQAGQHDILDVQLWQGDCQEWKGMRRAYGAVWDMVNPPKGPMNVRLLMTGTGTGSGNGIGNGNGNGGQNWVQLTGALPIDWKAGVAYDSAVQLV